MPQARKVLNNEKQPRFAADVVHQYSDKFALAEHLVSQASGAQINVLETMGVNPKTLRQMVAWAGDRSVTLSLRSEETCVFNRETKREVESASYVRDYGVGTISDKVVTTITEWFWDFTVKWELMAYVGNEPTDKFVLQSRTGKEARPVRVRVHLHSR